jgi:hypothetical protein
MIRVKLCTKWSCVGVKISTLAEVLVPWRALTELSATQAELYAPSTGPWSRVGVCLFVYQQLCSRVPPQHWLAFGWIWAIFTNLQMHPEPKTFTPSLRVCDLVGLSLILAFRRQRNGMKRDTNDWKASRFVGLRGRSTPPKARLGMCNALTKCRIPLTVWRAACADVSHVSAFLKTHKKNSIWYTGLKLLIPILLWGALQNHVETSILDAEERLPGRFSLHRVGNETTPSIFPASPVSRSCCLHATRLTILAPLLSCDCSSSLFNQETAWLLHEHTIPGLEALG